jgi:hypothetical protein
MFSFVQHSSLLAARRLNASEGGSRCMLDVRSDVANFPTFANIKLFLNHLFSIEIRMNYDFVISEVINGILEIFPELGIYTGSRSTSFNDILENSLLFSTTLYRVINIISAEFGDEN